MPTPLPQYSSGFWLNLSLATIEHTPIEMLAERLIAGEDPYPALFYLSDGNRPIAVLIALFQKLTGHAALNEAVLKTDKCGWNVLHHYARYHHEIVFKTLLEAITQNTLNKALVAIIPETHANLLHLVAKIQTESAVRKLIELASSAALFEAAACKNQGILSENQTALRTVLLFKGKEVYQLLVERIAAEIFHAVSTTHQAPEKLKALGYYKEVVKKHIFSLPKEEQIEVITDALKDSSPLNEFFKITRGTSSTSYDAGSFKELADQLQKLHGKSPHNSIWTTYQSVLSYLFTSQQAQKSVEKHSIELNIFNSPAPRA
jgi:hypothetical protein